MRGRADAARGSRSRSRRSPLLSKNAKRPRTRRNPVKNRRHAKPKTPTRRHNPPKNRRHGKPKLPRRSKPDGSEMQSDWASARHQPHLGFAMVREKKGIFQAPAGRHQDPQLPDGQTETG